MEVYAPSSQHHSPSLPLLLVSLLPRSPSVPNGGWDGHSWAAGEHWGWSGGCRRLFPAVSLFFKGT